MEYVRLLPKNTLSRTVGKIVRVKSPAWIARKARDWFIKRYNINMAEAEHDLESYPTIGDLFIRRLKPGVRPIGSGVVHPCDGVLTQAGEIKNGMLIQAKGIEYSVADLLKDRAAYEIYEGGYFLTYYLCPTDYHRVHTPIAAECTAVTHVPGRLWPVNPWSVENISQLFAINERVIFHLRPLAEPSANSALVMVGATNVGEISVSFDDAVRTNLASGLFSLGDATPETKTYSPPVRLEKGDEAGIFHMGSSVVMLYQKGVLSRLPKLGPVRLGESLG